MKPILKYPGAKNRIALWICDYIPEHKVYVEAFFGSGAVFFNKAPSVIETINDIDGEVVNFFRVLRENPDELYRVVSLTPYARDEYKEAYKNSEKDNEIERARKFAIRCWMGFGCGNRYQNGFRTSQQYTSPPTTRQWNEFAEVIYAAAERLKHAQIENVDALELIERYNTSDVFFYLDPPYVLGVRKNYLYNYETDDDYHEKLLKKLLKHPGKIIISGYDNDLYNDMLKGWVKVQKHTTAERGIQRTETIWMNYGFVQMNILNYLEDKNEFYSKTV